MNRLAVSAKARGLRVGTDLVVGAFRHLSLNGDGDDDRPLIATAVVNSWVPNFIN